MPVPQAGGGAPLGQIWIWEQWWLRNGSEVVWRINLGLFSSQGEDDVGLEQGVAQGSGVSNLWEED